MKLVTTDGTLPSPARVDAPTRGTVRVAVVQTAWHGDVATQSDVLRNAVASAVGAGASFVCLPELTLSPYFAIDPDPTTATVTPENLHDGPTVTLLRELCTRHAVTVSASLYESADADAVGFNTAVCVDAAGTLVAATRKLHLPVTEGYFEDRWFTHGDSGHPVHALQLTRTDRTGSGVATVRAGFPTCWDQWFCETARAYALGDADVVVYPTAIGSEPDHPDFDTRPIWEQVIVANGIMNGLHMIVPNRTGSETSADGATTIRFYGSSFVSDPYGRVLARAPRNEEAVVVADVDLDARRDWLSLFPLLATRRPDAYEVLTRAVRQED